MARVRGPSNGSVPGTAGEARSAPARDLGFGDASQVQENLDTLFALRDEDPALTLLERAARAFHESRAAEAEADAEG